MCRVRPATAANVFAPGAKRAYPVSNDVADSHRALRLESGAFMRLLAATTITWMDVFIISIAIKVFFIIFVVWLFRLVKHEEQFTRPAPPILATVAPMKRVAVVSCPFCESEQTASVRMELVDGETVYELVCWHCHAALPETTLVAVVEPREWLARSQSS